MTSRIRTERDLQVLSARNKLRTPQKTNLGTAGNTPANASEIILNKANSSFYGHNGINWVPLGGPAAECTLVDACVGPGAVYATFAAALAAGFSRVRITGAVTESPGVIVLPEFVHIWIDGGSEWTIPATTTFDASSVTSLTIEGNSRGTMIWTPTEAGQMMTPASNPTAIFTIKNIQFDLSSATSLSGPLQLWAQDALQFYENMRFVLPNIPDIQLIDLRLNTPATSTEIASAVSNVEFSGTGTSITRVIGHSGGPEFAGGHFTNLLFSGTFPTGDGGFGSPLIETSSPGLSNGALVFDGIRSDVTNVIYDLILSGNVTNVLRKDGVSYNFNVAYQGTFGATFSNSSVDIMILPGSLAGVDHLTAERVVVIGSDFRFTGCNFGAANPGPTATLTVSGSNNLFSGCSIKVGDGVDSPGIFIVSTASNTVFSGCEISDDYTTGTDRVMLISGSDTVISGCSKRHSGGAVTNLGSVEIDSGGARTIIQGYNMTGSTGAASPASTIVFTGTPADVIVVNNMFDNTPVGATGGASIVAGNIVL